MMLDQSDIDTIRASLLWWAASTKSMAELGDGLEGAHKYDECRKVAAEHGEPLVEKDVRALAGRVAQLMPHTECRRTALPCSRRVCGRCGEYEDQCECSAPAEMKTNMGTLEASILKFATEQWGEKTLERLANKLAEETGEVAGAVVKMPEGRATDADLDDELGDLLIVAAQFAARRETTLRDLLTRRWLVIRTRAKKARPS